MKILQVSSLYYPDEEGGAEVALRYVSEELARRGISVTVVCLAKSGQRQAAVINGVHVVRVPLANIYWGFGAPTKPSLLRRLGWHAVDTWNPIMARRLMDVVVIEQPDVVNFHNVSGFSAAAIRRMIRAGIPVVETLHDYYFACATTAMFDGAANCSTQCTICRFSTFALRRASLGVDHVVGVSEGMLRQVKRTGAFRNVNSSVMMGAIPPAKGGGELRQDHAPSSPLRLGFLGRLAETKGIETLVEAVRLVGDLPVAAVIAGRGEVAYEDTLRAAAHGLPIDFLGHVSPEAFFPQIDVLVVPSVWCEPMGRVALEAFAYGVPVIASDIGGLSEIVQRTGCGLLFPPRDSGQLAGIVRDMVLRGFAARRWQQICLAMSCDFSIEAYVDRLLRVYERLGTKDAPGAKIASATAERRPETPYHILRPVE